LVAVLAALTVLGDPVNALLFVLVLVALSLGIVGGARLWRRGIVALVALTDAVVAVLCLAVLFVEPWTQLQLSGPGGGILWIVALSLAAFGMAGAWSPPVPRVSGSRPTPGQLVVVACQSGLIALLLARLVWALTTVTEGYVGFAIPIFLGALLLISLGSIAWWIGYPGGLIAADVLAGLMGLSGLLHELALAGYEEAGQTWVILMAVWVAVAFAGTALSWRYRRPRLPVRIADPALGNRS
jgi:hypothetical protein